MKKPQLVWLASSTLPNHQQQQHHHHHHHHHHPQSLQTFHGPPTRTLQDVLSKIMSLEADDGRIVDPWDTYGDYDKPLDQSLLRQLEHEMAHLLGKQDAVCMPSGIMAQSIALLIHHHGHKKDRSEAPRQPHHHHPPKNGSFACHPTCHLLLHEENAYSELLGMSAVIVHPSQPNDTAPALSIPPMLYDDVVRTLDEHYYYYDSDHHHQSKNRTNRDAGMAVATLLVELPHREIGGQLTPWEDILRLREYCTIHDIRFHCDGARFLEASVGGYDHPSLAVTAAPFDSIYISLYKGLGGFAGSLLVGSSSFCNQARIWLTRFGGNLHTLAPYMVAGKLGLDRYYHNAGKMMKSGEATIASFRDLKNKMKTIVALLQDDRHVRQVVAFNPPIPETNMVHGYFQETAEFCHQAINEATQESGIRVLHRIRDLREHDMAYQLGFRSKFEWTLGPVNGAVSVENIHSAWKIFAVTLLKAKNNNDNSVVE